MDLFAYVWITWLLLVLFVVGSMVGSFLNVCIARLPLGLSLVRPGLRCGHCHTPIRMSDNVPLLSYWLLRGRCRRCGVSFSMRYFWVELLTGLSFVALYWLEVVLNVHRYAAFGPNGWWYVETGRFPPHAWPLYLFHVVMLCFLIVAVFCALERGTVPRGVVLGGVGVGLLGAMLFPWPWPHKVEEAIRTERTPVHLLIDGSGRPDGPLLQLPAFRRSAMDPEQSWAAAAFSPREGVYPWPVWGPLPRWLPAASWQLGLATGLAGLLVGGGLAALVRLGFSDTPACADLSALRSLRHGDAAVMLLAGSFLGWQPAAVAVLGAALLAVIVALAAWPWRAGHACVPDRPRKATRSLAPYLALGIVVASLGWPWLGPCLYPVLFDGRLVGVLAVGVPVTVICIGLALGRLPRLRGTQVCGDPAPQAADQSEQGPEENAPTEPTPLTESGDRIT